MRLGLVQMTSSDDPGENRAVVLDRIAEAARAGVDLVATPEVTNCVSTDRAHQRAVLMPEARDGMLSAVRDAARDHGIWVLLGSLVLRTADPEGRFANRSILIDDQGRIAARYDKIHMFDVEVSPSETYRESAGFRPGSRATLAQTPWGGLGMTVCYDLRFPDLFRRLAQAGAGIITVPSAFSPVTGAAHWEVLLRARAIETGAWIIAPAQVGTHAASSGKGRTTWGHSLVVAPWGEVALDMGETPGLGVVEIDLDDVASARARVPAYAAPSRWDGP